MFPLLRILDELIAKGASGFVGEAREGDGGIGGAGGVNHEVGETIAAEEGALADIGMLDTGLGDGEFASPPESESDGETAIIEAPA